MDLGLGGRVAFVAGASQGLGRAVAEALAAEGARVVLCARRESHLRAAAEEIAGRTRATVGVVAADLARPASRPAPWPRRSRSTVGSTSW